MNKITKQTLITLLFSVFIIFFVHNAKGQYRVTLKLKLPSNSPNNASYFLSSEYNKWNSRDSAYIFKKIDGVYQMTFNYDSKYWLQYKITRGSDSSEESDVFGYGVSNRLLEVKKDTTVNVNVIGWKDLIPKQHTYSSSVHIISDSFPMKSLNRKRRVWIYLPPSYKNSNNKYPVIYMQDGDELFDKAATDDGKEWRVDEILDSLYRTKGTEVIIVGIAASDKNRGTEYSAYPLKNISHYDGKAYLSFLINELMPYVNHHYRTNTSASNTAISGCSMGGLISLYAILHYNNIFGSAALLSPAYWNVSSLDSLKQDMRKCSKKMKSNIFLYGGDNEGVSNRLEILAAFDTILSTNPNNKVKFIITKGGRHMIPYWSEPFTEFVEWVYDKPKNLSDKESK
jgi:predicted alpha/beta superfamily hydrolase